MNIAEIIAEANVLVPNEVEQAQKLVWLNAINQDFFNVVKIPRVINFATIAGQSNYNFGDDLKSKNITRVSVGSFWYNNFNFMELGAVDSYFTFDDSQSLMTLKPAPYANDVGVVRAFRVATTTFTSNNTDALPDAPVEYHWTYIPALASYLANTQDDGIKASNFETQYKSSWNVAAQNYQQGG